MKIEHLNVNHSSYTGSALSGDVAATFAYEWRPVDRNGQLVGAAPRITRLRATERLNAAARRELIAAIEGELRKVA